MRKSEIRDYLIECFATLRAVSKKGHFTKAFQIVPKNALERYWTHYEVYGRSDGENTFLSCKYL
jgi:hypothetical protein